MLSRNKYVKAVLAAMWLALLAGLLVPVAPGGARGGDANRPAWARMLGLPAAAADDKLGPYAAFQEALAVLKRDYAPAPIDQKKAQTLTYAAIEGMLSSLNDPFTGFLDQDEWKQMMQTTQGSFEGIGAVLEPVGRDVRVVRPIPGSPAFKAGLRAGDVILSVGQHNTSTGRLLKTVPTLGKTISEVVKLIKGPRGTKVTVTVLRRTVARPITVTLLRAHIEPPTVMHWMEDDQYKIGRIVLTEFNEKSEDQIDRAAAELKKRGMKALVFDLRSNPGGLLTAAVNIGSRFVDKGPIVIVQESNGQRHRLQARPMRAALKDYPLVVLVNEGSASASEIVAGAIKDNNAGTLIGQHTFGKGLVQTLFPLPDETAVRLTTAKYFTPSGRDINNQYDEEHRPKFGTGGIKPDVEVKQSEDWLEQNFEDRQNDTQLAKALEVLRGRLAKADTHASAR